MYYHQELSPGVYAYCCSTGRGLQDVLKFSSNCNSPCVRVCFNMNLAFESFETLSKKLVNVTTHTHIPAQPGSLQVGSGRRTGI